MNISTGNTSTAVKARHGYSLAPAAGFTMVELLVAVLILSFGLMGLAALQTEGLRSNQSAYMRTQATMLAYDIADRMRSNRGVALFGAYDIAIGAQGASGTVAGDDLLDWKTSMAAELPLGDGSVSRNGNVFSIIVQWDDKRDASDLQVFATDVLL